VSRNAEEQRREAIDAFKAGYQEVKQEGKKEERPVTRWSTAGQEVATVKPTDNRWNRWGRKSTTKVAPAVWEAPKNEDDYDEDDWDWGED